MTFTEIHDKLIDFALDIEKYHPDYLSEEMLILADEISDLESSILNMIKPCITD